MHATSNSRRFRIAVATAAALLLCTATAAAQAPPARTPYARTRSGGSPSRREQQAARPVRHGPLRGDEGRSRGAAEARRLPTRRSRALGDQKLGVVAWGNGGCSNDGASSRFHLLELASHGYLVIASGRILSGPGAAAAEPRAPAQPGQPPPARTLPADLTDAIDWALAENQRTGSPYFGRIDPAQVALSGWSCGGLQALRVANDPRVTAVVLHNTACSTAGRTRPSPAWT